MINPTSYIVDTKTKPMTQSDVIITTSNKIDEERVDYIKKIKAETNFYNVFRNTIKILLNDYKNSKQLLQTDGIVIFDDYNYIYIYSFLTIFSHFQH